MRGEFLRCGSYLFIYESIIVSILKGMFSCIRNIPPVLTQILLVDFNVRSLTLTAVGHTDKYQNSLLFG